MNSLMAGIYRCGWETVLALDQSHGRDPKGSCVADIYLTVLSAVQTAA